MILTIILTDGPYISEYSEIAYKIAKAALKRHQVNIFLYLDAVHIPRTGQKPTAFANASELFEELAVEGAYIRACIRCSTARGYCPIKGECREYPAGIGITSLHDLAEMLRNSDKVISLSR